MLAQTEIRNKQTDAKEADSEDDGNDEANDDWSRVVDETKASNYNPDKVRDKQVEIAKIRVQLNESKEDLELAVAASDFVKAHEVKIKIDELTKEQVALEDQLKALRQGEETPKSLVKSNSSKDGVIPIVAKFPALFEGQDDPEEPSPFEDTDDEDDFAPPGTKKIIKKKKRGSVKKVKRLKKGKPKAPTFLCESIVGKYSVLIHREDPDYEDGKESTPEQPDDLTKIDDFDENPNFALAIDFMSRFGAILGLRGISIKDLQLMLGAEGPPHIDLIQLHMTMLRKIKLPKIIITKKSWEKAMVMFCKGAGDMTQEGKELSSRGYAGLSLSVRLELLKRLMEAQFDLNEEVRTEVDELDVEALRIEPTGKDVDGQIYWTQIDETADIRVYSEDCRYFTWGSIAQNREEVVTLVERLKEDKLYKKEMERLRQISEKKEQEKREIVDAVEMIENEMKSQSQCDENQPKSFSCEICNENFERGMDLKEHHSRGHMSLHIQAKFPHLVNKTQCKICKFDPGEEDLIWAHIGTMHDKVNMVLKENGLAPIADDKDLNEDIHDPEYLSDVAENEEPSPQTNSNDDEVIEKLEMKINQLKHQMEKESNNEQVSDDNERDSSEQVPNKETDDEVKSPRKRGRPSKGSDKSKKSNSRKSSRSKSKGKQGKTSKSTTQDSSQENESNMTESDTEKPSPVIDEAELTPGRRPSRKCKEFYEVVKAAEFSFRKPTSTRKNSLKISSKDAPKSKNNKSSKSSSKNSSDREEDSIENIAEFLEETQGDKKEIKNEDEDDSGFESKDVKDETDEDETKAEESPIKRARKCKNKSYNDDDPFGEMEEESAEMKNKIEEKIEEEKVTVKEPVEEEEVMSVDLSKTSLKERKEKKLSCKRCNEWKDDDLDPVFSCPSCHHGWHQSCATPPLHTRPPEGWLCPLCQHIALVGNLEKTLMDLDLKMEEAEERRLAALTENQQNLTRLISDTESEEEEEEEEEEVQRTPSPNKSPKITIQNNSAEITDVPKIDCEIDSDESSDEIKGRGKKSIFRPNYNELSSSDEDEQPQPVVPAVSERTCCNCEGKGTCLFCKRMKGCTCEGAGTCRLCMSELVIDEESGNKSSSPELEVLETPKMSTTELFLLTGQTRQTPVSSEESIRGRGKNRGRGRGRGRTSRPTAARGRGRGGIFGDTELEAGEVRPESPSGQVVLLDSHTLRPTGMRASLRSRGRMLTAGGRTGEAQQGLPSQLVRPRGLPRPGGVITRPRQPGIVRPDMGGSMVRGAVRPARPIGQPRMVRPLGGHSVRPMRQMRPVRPMLQSEYVQQDQGYVQHDQGYSEQSQNYDEYDDQNMGYVQQSQQYAPKKKVARQPSQESTNYPLALQYTPEYEQYEQFEEIENYDDPDDPSPCYSGYTTQSQSYVQQNTRGYAPPRKKKPVRAKNMGYPHHNQTYEVAQSPAYSDPSQGYSHQKQVIRPSIRYQRARPPAAGHSGNIRPPRGLVPQRMQPVMSARGRAPRLQRPPIQRGVVQSQRRVMSGPRLALQHSVRMRGQPPAPQAFRGQSPTPRRSRAMSTPQGGVRNQRGRATMRGAMAQKEAPVAPQIVSLHSNRLTGIMNNHYPNDGTEVVDLDDDDDDEDSVIVPQYNTGYQQTPAPDFDIIADDEMQNFDTSGEYIEDAYEADEQPKYFQQLGQQTHHEVYDLE